MNNGYSICFNEWALDEKIKNELRLLLIISSLCAEKGYCYASNKYLADLFNETEISISRKINNLSKNNYISIEYEKRGCEITSRKIRLTKLLTDDYQNCYSTINKNVKENNISNNNISNNNKKEIYKEKELKEMFEDVWNLYPNKKGKTNAYRDFSKALKDGVPLETIQQGLETYIKYIEIERVEPKFIKNGSTWFHQRCWEDDYTIKRKLTTKDIASKMDFTDFLNKGGRTNG